MKEKTNEQKIRECAAELDRMAMLKRIEFNSVPFEEEYTEILTRHFGHPEQLTPPDTHLDKCAVCGEKAYRLYVVCKKHLNQPEQPDKSLKEIVAVCDSSIQICSMKKYYPDFIRQACLEHAAQVRQSAAREAAELVTPEGCNPNSHEKAAYKRILTHFNIPETKGAKE